MKVEVTKEDFDAAVAQLWDTKTCIMAQVAKRLNQTLYSVAGTDWNPSLGSKEQIGKIVGIFDGHFLFPGDEKTKPELIALRESLPITLSPEWVIQSTASAKNFQISSCNPSLHALYSLVPKARALAQTQP